MNHLLESEYCLFVPAFISMERAGALAQGLADHCASSAMLPDPTVPMSPAVYNHMPFLRLLVEKIPQVQSLCGESVLPTYSYARIYGCGDILPAHSDRDACELSLTLNLRADQAWPFWLKKPGVNPVSVLLQPGDALMYLGCQTTHWREPFAGNECMQVFLHYVFSYGSKAYAYFDKQHL